MNPNDIAFLRYDNIHDQSIVFEVGRSTHQIYTHQSFDGRSPTSETSVIAKNPFPIDRDKIKNAAKINARSMYNKCMNNLQKYGHIKHLPSSNSFTHRIIYF
jgi:hypothetical protein